MKYVDSVYEAEIKKPEAEQDADLIEECLETMSYLHDTAELLARQTQNRSIKSGSRVTMRRAAVAAIAFAVLFISMTVAEASGFRIWSALIHWDSGYLHITYEPEGQNALPTEASETALDEGTVEGAILEATTCETVAEVKKKLGLRLLLPQYLPEGMKETDVSYVAVDQYTVELTIRWSGSERYINLHVSSNQDADSSSDYLFPTNDRDIRSFSYAGITFYRIGDQVHWVADNTAYTMDTNIGDTELEPVLTSLSYE